MIFRLIRRGATSHNVAEKLALMDISHSHNQSVLIVNMCWPL